MDHEALRRYLHRRVNDSYLKTKRCYILGCQTSPIKAHSISRARYLDKIADNGNVMYMSSERMSENGESQIIPIGRGKATTFPGFCDVHDKIFEAIDAHDYIYNDSKLNYLFAFRAAAREYAVRMAMQDNFETIISQNEESSVSQDFLLAEQGLSMIKEHLKGFSVGTKELEAIRVILNKNLEKLRYWKIKSIIIEIDKEYPIVASSVFKLELDIDGVVINYISNLQAKGKPLFFTLFPQLGKTICILSWFKNDDSDYVNLYKLVRESQEQKKVTISNLLTSYVENFAASPTYWEALPTETKEIFNKHWGDTMSVSITPFVFNNQFSLFQ